MPLHATDFVVATTSAPTRRFLNASANTVSLQSVVDTMRTAMLVETVSNRLQSLRSLHERWDGYGAVPVDPRALDYAGELFAEIACPNLTMPSVVPTTDGGVDFEWHTASHHIAISIDAPGRFRAFLQNRQNGRSVDQEFSNPANALPYLKAALVGDEA